MESKQDVFDFGEAELPETLFVQDIDDRVFKSIVLQCLAEIDGVSLKRRGVLRSFFSKGRTDPSKGIVIEQDPHSQTISIKLEMVVHYGVPIPEKAEEIQKKVSEQITHMTGLHVSCVHVIFMNSVTSSVS